MVPQLLPNGSASGECASDSAGAATACGVRVGGVGDCL